VHVHEPGRYDDEPALGNALLLPAGEDDEARPADKGEERVGPVPVRTRQGSSVEEDRQRRKRIVSGRLGKVRDNERWLKPGVGREPRDCPASRRDPVTCGRPTADAEAAPRPVNWRGDDGAQGLDLGRGP